MVLHLIVWKQETNTKAVSAVAF